MKKFYLIAALFMHFYGNSFAQTFEWVRTGGSGLGDIGQKFAFDSQRNVYSTGYYYGQGDFDLDTPGFELGFAGETDIFIQKHDAFGNLLWIKSIGSTGSESPSDIQTDGDDNIYLAGGVVATLDVDPGPDVFNLNVSAGLLFTVFVEKLTKNGDFIWAHTLPGRIRSTNVDEEGNLLVTGTFSGTADFDPGAGDFSVTSNGSEDVFLLKLDTNGNFLWVKTIGSPGEDAGVAIARDPSGNIYLTGIARGTADFDPGPNEFVVVPTVFSNFFILKLDADGNFIRVAIIDANSFAVPSDMTIDAQGNICMVGVFSEEVDFDPGPGVFTLQSAGPNLNPDVFVEKLDQEGNFLWAVRMGGPQEDIGTAIATDASGAVYTTGLFGTFGSGMSLTVDFDPGPGVHNLVSEAGGFNAFVQKLNAQGNFVWAHKIGANNFTFDEGNDIHVDAGQNIFITGDYEGADFDPGSGVVTVPNVSGFTNGDVFVVKWSQCPYTSGSLTAQACGSYALNGQTYSQSGTYTQFLTNSAGCDSLLTLNLTIQTTIAHTINVTSCEPYTLNGETYTSSGVYTQNLTSSNGCDSLLTLNLTIHAATTQTLNASSCEPYTLNGQVYTQSGSYTQTLINSNGCDSLLVLNLTINTTDASVTQEGTTLTANTAGALYQWVDCDEMSEPIPFENGQSFTPTASGNYAVVVLQNGCPVLSDCFSVTIVGTQETQPESRWQVYPNPTSGPVSFAVPGGAASGIAIDIRNMLGQLVHQQTGASSDVLILNLDLPAGIYNATIRSGQQLKTVSLIVE